MEGFRRGPRLAPNAGIVVVGDILLPYLNEVYVMLFGVQGHVQMASIIAEMGHLSAPLSHIALRASKRVCSKLTQAPSFRTRLTCMTSSPGFC